MLNWKCLWDIQVETPRRHLATSVWRSRENCGLQLQSWQPPVWQIDNNIRMGKVTQTESHVSEWEEQGLAEVEPWPTKAFHVQGEKKTSIEGEIESTRTLRGGWRHSNNREVQFCGEIHKQLWRWQTFLFFFFFVFFLELCSNRVRARVQHLNYLCVSLSGLVYGSLFSTNIYWMTDGLNVC